MKSRLLVASTTFITVLGIGGCDGNENQMTSAGATGAGSSAGAPAPSASVGTTIDDTAITARVKSSLLADPDIRSLDITVETRKGEVQLSGFVDSQTQIERAGDIAKRTQGVTLVDNKLALKKPGTVGNAVDDTIVTAKVKTALLRDDAVKSLDISVHTSKGDVQLSGYVDNEAQIARATDVARSVEGVATVANKMSVKK